MYLFDISDIVFDILSKLRHLEIKKYWPDTGYLTVWIFNRVTKIDFTANLFNISYNGFHRTEIYKLTELNNYYLFRENL